MVPQDTPSDNSVAVSQTSQSVSEARRVETEATPASSSHSLLSQHHQEEKIKAIGNYVLLGKTLGKGNFARVELASHCLTKAKVCPPP